MEERKLRVYIAGPMTGGTGHSFNMKKINEAIQAYFTLITLGYVPHCPHLTVFCEFMQPDRISYEQWLTLDRNYIEDSDVVLRIEGISPGSDRECDYAKSRGIPVVYGLGNFLVQYKEAPV